MTFSASFIAASSALSVVMAHSRNSSNLMSRGFDLAVSLLLMGMWAMERLVPLELGYIWCVAYQIPILLLPCLFLTKETGKQKS